MKHTTAVPAQKTTRRFRNAIKNILTIYNQATPEELQGGLGWYQEAKDFAQDCSQKFGFPLEVVAAIISALSPATDWEINKADTLRVLENNTTHRYATYGQNVRKAFEIRNNPDLWSELGTCFPSDKTFNFFHNICQPEANVHVTIDRHALSVALGQTREDKTVTRVEYRELSRHYKTAAKRLNVLPQQVQAVTWVVWRNRKGRRAKFTLADMLEVSMSLGA